MSWFGLFDRLRLHPGPGDVSWPLPGSQLRVADAGLASLYREAIVAAGDPWRADMFDLAGHFLARTAAAGAGRAHLDARITGRPQRILFGEDQDRGLIAWHAADDITVLRLPGSPSPAAVALPHANLLGLLQQTLPITALPTVSLWAETALDVVTLLKAIAPWLLRESRAVVRLPPSAARELLAQLADLPAVCAAIVPCTGAADHDGRGEDPTELLLCLEDLSTQTAAEAARRAGSLSREGSSGLWNLQDREWRTARQGGVCIQLPLPGRALSAGWPPAVIEAGPGGPLGAALALLQTQGLRATTGFDYVAEVRAATVLAHGPAVLLVPQDGPAVLDPRLLPGADSDSPADPEETRRVVDELAVAGWTTDTAAPVTLVTRRAGPVRRLSDRPAFLLGATDVPTQDYLTAIWPRLEQLLQLAERGRVAPDDFDILAPGPAHRLLRDSVASLGLDPARVQTCCDDVLYREILTVPPACQTGLAQRSAGFDQFWQRLARDRSARDFISFTRPPAPDRFYLTTREGPCLLNGGALAKVAASRGLRVIDTDGLDFETLATTLAQARVIVGTAHALAWACFARACQLGVLIGDGEPAPPYAVLHVAASCAHSVTLACGTSIGAGGFAVGAARFEALLDRVDTPAPTMARRDVR